MNEVHPKFLELDNNQRINALHQAIEDLASGRQIDGAVFERPAEPVLSPGDDQRIATLDGRLSRLEAAMSRLVDQLSEIKGH